MRLIKNIFKIRSKIYISIIISILAFIFTSKNMMATVPNGVKLSLFDLISLPNSGGLISKISLAFPIIPIYCFLLVSLLNIDNKAIVIIREKSKEKLWNKTTYNVILFSLIFSIIITLTSVLLSGILLKGFTNGWIDKGSIIYEMMGNSERWNLIRENMMSMKILSKIFFGLFLGLSAIGFVIQILMIKVSNSAIYSLISLFVFGDMLNGRLSILLDRMTLSTENLISNNFAIYNYFILFLSCVILYIIGKEINEKRDFFQI